MLPVSVPYPLNLSTLRGEVSLTAPMATSATTAVVTVESALAVTAPLASVTIPASLNALGLVTARAPMPSLALTGAGIHPYPTYSIQFDWNNDGDYTDGNEDVTEDVNALAGVSIQYGRDGSQPFAPTAGGTASLTLDNFEDKYNPANPESPLYGLLIPGRPVRMRTTIGAATYSLFTGHTDDSPIEPDAGEQTAEFSLLDNLARLRSQKVNTALYWGVRTGYALHRLLDAVGWPAGLRDIDVGGSVLPWWWASDANAYDAAVDLVAAEGPPALLSVGPSGEIVFRDRHHRLARSQSTTNQAVFLATEFAEGSKVSLSWAEVINHVQFEVHERAGSADLTEVWQSDDIIALADGETTTLRVQTTEPFYQPVTPQLNVDYTMQAGTVVVSLALAAAQRAHIQISAFGGPAIVSGMSLRAFSAPVVRTRIVELEDTASIAKYGRRSWPQQAPFVNIHDARAQAAIIISTRADPLRQLTGRMIAMNGSEIANQVARDLSDRIEVTGDTLLTGQWFVDKIEHRFDGRVGHTTTFTCEEVPRQIGSVFILGSATSGVLGTNKLGRMALDEPQDVFIVGSASNGKLGTHVLAY